MPRDRESIALKGRTFGTSRARARISPFWLRLRVASVLGVLPVRLREPLAFGFAKTTNSVAQFFSAVASLRGGLDIGSGAVRATSCVCYGFVGYRPVLRSDFA